MNASELNKTLEHPKPSTMREFGPNKAQIMFWQRQPSVPQKKEQTSPTFLAFSLKKTETKEPLCFNKTLKTQNSANSGNLTAGNDSKGLITVTSPKMGSTPNASQKDLARFPKATRDSPIKMNNSQLKNGEKGLSSSSNAIQNKQSTSNPLEKIQSKTPITGGTAVLSFANKFGLMTKVNNPEISLTFKKKEPMLINKPVFQQSSPAGTPTLNRSSYNQAIGNNRKISLKKIKSEDNVTCELEETAASIQDIEFNSPKQKMVQKPIRQMEMKVERKDSLPPNFAQATLQDFTVIKYLGKGIFGNVSMVVHNKTGFICALKVMEKAAVKDQKLKTQLMREIKIQFHLRHQNIVQLYGFFHDEKSIYLLLELCTQGQLFKILRDRKRLPEQEAQPLIRQLCEAMGYLHKQRILHRDIKPQNLLLHEGLIKLCDFGWSVQMSSSLRDTFCGTPVYASPQILKGVKYDQKIDIWSIGVLSYQMLVGRPPFKIHSTNDFAKIINDQISFPEYVPLSDHAKDFIRVILQKNPDKRLDIEGLLKHNFLQQK